MQDDRTTHPGWDGSSGGVTFFIGGRRRTTAPISPAGATPHDGTDPIGRRHERREVQDDQDRDQEPRRDRTDDQQERESPHAHRVQRDPLARRPAQLKAASRQQNQQPDHESGGKKQWIRQHALMVGDLRRATAGTAMIGAMRTLPTGTVTFLFTDIEGSTRLLHERGEEYADLLAEHRRVLRAIFAATTASRSTRRATRSSSPSHVRAMPWPPPQEIVAEEGPIRVRIGIHTGTPVVTAEGYVGLDVHRAARICAAAHGGQVVLSEATVRSLGVDPGRDLGLHRLKDFGAPERLFQLGQDPFPPLRSLNATNLPAQPGALIGRAQEVREIVDLIETARVVTLTGAGGSGKTRLALQVAAESVDRFGGGVFWVQLAAVTDPDLIEPTIAQAIGADHGLVAHIDEKRMLLLLDNLEQLLPGAAAPLSELMSACPNLRLLATSRAPLRIAGEREYPVLPLPDERRARALSRTRLRHRTGGGRRGDLPPPGRAATRHRARGSADTPASPGPAARASRACPADPDRWTPRRPGTAANASRDDRLEPRPAVGRGTPGCSTVSASSSAASRSRPPRRSAMPTWRRSDRSSSRASSGAWTTVASGCSRPSSSSRSRGSRPRTMLRRPSPATRPSSLPWRRSASLTVESQGNERVEIVLPELANLRAVLERSLATGDVELGLSLAVTLEQFWTATSPAEGTRWIEAFLDGGPVAPELRARALRVLGGTLYIVGRFEEGTEYHLRSLAEFRRLDDRFAVSHMLFRLAIEASRSGDNASGVGACRGEPSREPRSITLGRGAGTQLAWHPRPRRWTRRRGSRTSRPKRQARRAGGRTLVAGQRAIVGRRVRQRAGPSRTIGRPRPDGLAVAREIGDRQSMAYGLAVLAWVAAALGRSERAGWLWGAIEAEQERADLGQWKLERDTYEQRVFIAAGDAFERGRSRMPLIRRCGRVRARGLLIR